MSNQTPRKAQTGEPTGNGGHFGSRTRPDGALTDMDLERLKDANSFGGTEEFEKVRAELDAKAEDAAERAAAAYRNGWDDDDETVLCGYCDNAMVDHGDGETYHVDSDGNADREADEHHIAQQ